MRVWLSSVPAGGTAASLALPQQLLDPLAITDHLTPARRISQPQAVSADALPAAIPSQRAGEPIRAALPAVPLSVSAPPAPATPAMPAPAMPAPAMPAQPMPTLASAADPAPVPAANGGYMGSARVPATPVGATPVAGHPPNGTATPRPFPLETSDDGEALTFTTAGLPKRGAGASLAEDLDETLSMPPGAPGTLDPDDVRARLSSLSKGLAAANRYGPTPTPTAPR
jgi:hypothetical protein